MYFVMQNSCSLKEAFDLFLYNYKLIFAITLSMFIYFSFL